MAQRARQRRRAFGFTLMELMLAMVVAALIASTALMAMWGAMEEARGARTRAQIDRIHEILLNQWESYLTRPVRAAGVSPADFQKARLLTIRDLMRMELPDRQSDLLTPPLFNTAPNTPWIDPTTFDPSSFPDAPYLWRTHMRRLQNLMYVTGEDWTSAHQQAECLYLILSSLRDEDQDALSYFGDGEIGNLDGDAVPEILDAWGHPIAFLRWAPGFSEHRGLDGEWGAAGVDDDNDGFTDTYAEAGWRSSPPVLAEDDFLSPSAIQTQNASKMPDPLDTLRIDPRWTDNDVSFDPFLLFPLVFSAGPNALPVDPLSGDMASGVAYGLAVDNDSSAIEYRQRGKLSSSTYWYEAMDPYQLTAEGYLIGTPYEFVLPNYPPTGLITNHMPEAQ